MAWKMEELTATLYLFQVDAWLIDLHINTFNPNI